ncbi:MAG: isoleucine--tRNA ligase [Clostridiales bacterium]|nr:isoleucine--tRNA ligase [Clostridiales bacterium]
MPQDMNKTLNLPNTDFPMRAGLPQREPEMLKNWESESLYETLIQLNKDKPKFILHDGPPYANGDIHMGHALNKILKDFINRYKNMAGFCAPYVPGWDTHGLPIERQAIKAYGINRDKVSTAEFREKCREFAMKHVNTQKEQFKRLGCIGEWDNPYLTLTHDFEARQIEVFGEMAKRGYIYKGMKPVYWCPHDETALAEAEIEYQESKCDSIYVKFALKEDHGKIKSLIGTTDKVYFVIWTTTTWTLPGNVAISLNPEFEYDFVKAENGEIYILAHELLESVAKTAGIVSYKILGSMKGAELENMVAKHPIIDRDSLIIVGDHVTLDAGTGCVHTAPGHGAEDFVVCQNYDLPIIVPVDDKGYMNAHAGKYNGIYYDKTNKLIVEDLKQVNALLAVEAIDHTYPHCWRCKNPIVFRATEQWFCSIDALKDSAVDACRNHVKWLPGWGEERIVSMIRERSDWCISRQRIWGVPIPIFYCKECKKPIINEQTIKIVSDLFRKEGSNAWFSKEASEILPEGYCCEECGCHEFTKETDTMDVWFDSGSSHAAVLDERDDLQFPADVYLEGNDQYRGWFQSSLLTSIATKGVAPYKIVITHGMTVDEEARKMSKSLGNGISPSEIVKEYGADILRLWVSSADYRQDMRMSKEMFKQLSQNYLKIRNTARYILGNLDGFDPNRVLSYDELTELDRWALMKLNALVKKVIQAYEDFEYHIVSHAVHNFCVVDMSNFYLDVIKDRLYCETTDGKLRKSAQTTMYYILDAMVRLLAPILVFTSDEIWKVMPHHKDANPDRVSYNEMPKADEKYEFPKELNDKWDHIVTLRDDVNGVLEKARAEKLIGKPLEAKVTLFAKGSALDFINKVKEMLPTLFIVSQVNVANGSGGDVDFDYFDEKLGVSVEKASGEKCERCWIYSESVGENNNYPTLCDRCASVIDQTK